MRSPMPGTSSESRSIAHSERVGTDCTCTCACRVVKDPIAADIASLVEPSGNPTTQASATPLGATPTCTHLKLLNALSAPLRKSARATPADLSFAACGLV